jgi:hypothetical protein
MPTIVNVIGSYRQTFVSGLTAGIGAGTATLGHILALRNATSGKANRIRSFEAEFILTTAFGAAQEVGYDLSVARSYTVAHGAGTALTLGTNDGKYKTSQASTFLTGRIANASAMTAGTHTFDANPIARGSIWCGAVGARLEPVRFDYTNSDPGGIILAENEGLVARNMVLMGASGVGRWYFTVEWDDVLIG